MYQFIQYLGYSSKKHALCNFTTTKTVSTSVPDRNLPPTFHPCKYSTQSRGRIHRYSVRTHIHSMSYSDRFVSYMYIMCIYVYMQYTMYTIENSN